MGQSTNTPAASAKSATAAVFLSFLWPGLGQAYLGRRRAAAVFAVPILVVVLVLAWLARDGIDLLLARLLLVPSAATTLVVVAAAAGLWRLAAMLWAALDERARALRAPVRGPRDPAARRLWATLGVLAAIVVLVHGTIMWTGMAFLGATSQIYISGPVSPGNSALPGDIGPLPTPWATPQAGGRINILLVGADSGMGYNHSLTDTMILVSVDPVTDHVDMLSFPRDIARFPLYLGGEYDGKLNSLATYAAANPKQFPDGGIATLAREIGYLIGVPVNYYAFINLAGFQTLIDTVGGVDIVNPRAIADAGYEFPDHTVGFFLSAGPHHLDGRLALAYVRSREGPGDSDFTRAARQQELLVALRTKLTNPGMLPQLPAVLNALANVIQTDYPPDGVPDLIALSKQIPAQNVSHYVLGPPYSTHPADITSVYILLIDQQKFAALSVRLFGTESAYASPSPGP